MLEKITSEQWALALVSFSGLTLVVALIMEYGFGLVPCPLCLMQRIWVFWAGLFAYVSLLHNPRWGIYPLMSIISSIIGGGFSIRQLYLQGLPEDEVPSCGPDLAYMIDAFPLADLLAAMTSGTGDCAKVSASFLGLSIPGWTLLAFIGLVILACFQWRARSVSGPSNLPG
jgi:disulfide bond formation protein DsbB